MKRVGAVLAIMLLGACSDDDSVAPARVPDEVLPGVYSGIFPCDGCPGIPTTLWLRPDGRFFFEQEYPANDKRQAMTTHSLGRWSRGVGDGVINLAGAGPQRRFTPVDMHTLSMQTDSDLEHQLLRAAQPRAFTASITMTGMLRLTDGGASFSECRTGLAAPVDNGREFRRLMHQYRSTVTRGRPALVELVGRFSWSADDSATALTIERFITVRPDGAC